MSIKLVVTDLDGTLLTSDKKVSPRAMRAIEAMREKGVYFTIATGRNTASAAGIIRQFQIQAPVIVGNGAFVHDPDGKKFYHKELMPEKDIQTVMDVTREMDTSFYAFDEELIYCPRTRATEESVRWFAIAKNPILQKSFRWFDTYEQVMEAVSGRTAKLLIIEGDLEKNARVRAEVERRVKVMIVNSEPEKLDISNYGVSKGRAIRQVAEILGLKKEEVLALGDGENDAEMMENAGIGVAMKNAVDAVKNAADFVTLDNDADGFAYAIERFVLHED